MPTRFGVPLPRGHQTTGKRSPGTRTGTGRPCPTAVLTLATLQAEETALDDRLAAYGILSCYLVRVFVSVHKFIVVGMRVRVGLSVVTVFVLVLDVVMIVQDVRVRMRYVPVRVLMTVLCCGHSFAPFSTLSFFESPKPHVDGPSTKSRLHAGQGLLATFLSPQFNAP
jgi:hypothetical protein